MTPAGARTLETAADALARLGVVVASAPGAFALALRAKAVGELAAPPVKASTAILAAAPSADLALPTQFVRWIDFMDEEERRARGGAPLTMNRLARGGMPDGMVKAEGRERLATLLAPASGTSPRPAALERAVAVAALITDRAWSEAVAALVLCGEGRMDRMWLVPFGRVAEDDRAAALAAWNEGDEAPWATHALEALSTAARSHRARVERAIEDLPAEDERLVSLGRAAITARRALLSLRTSLVTSVPALADELTLSRPAAGDALERLVAAGLAVEVTGRQRGRMFAYAAALVATA